MCESPVPSPAGAFAVSGGSLDSAARQDFGSNGAVI